MKKVTLIAPLLLLLSACSSSSLPQINLTPAATLSPNTLVNNKVYSISSKDIRSAQYVALLDNGDLEVKPLHPKQNLRILLEDTLKKQFSSQGYHEEFNSSNNIKIEVQEALANVQHSFFSYNIDGQVIFSITAENEQGKLVKTYYGNAQLSGMFSVSEKEIEQVLTDIINLILAEIANDVELQEYMQSNF